MQYKLDVALEPDAGLSLGDSHEGKTSRPLVVPLTDPRAGDASLVGGKAASLARAAAAGLPVLPGFAVTVAGASAMAQGSMSSPRTRALESALATLWRELSKDGTLPVVVRSSSTVEDTDASSMAGVFESVVDVRGWSDFTEAIAHVLASNRLRASRGEAPMGVLVQQHLDPTIAGIMFGVDPVSGRSDRMVVAAVEGHPGALVGGEVQGARYVVTESGRTVERDAADSGVRLSRSDRKDLVALQRRAATAFGAPQDLEWGVDSSGALWLFQSRPITTITLAEKGLGHVLGPGPLAETFPRPLSAFEEELWVDPLRDAARAALGLVGAAGRRRLERSPLIVSVGGRIAADLSLFDPVSLDRSFLVKLDPRPAFRRLAAAWRVGRLRAAFPALAADLLKRTDTELAKVPSMSELLDDDLLNVIANSRAALVSLHGHEILAGLLVRGKGVAPSGASAALSALARGRTLGRTDDEITASDPSVLALVPPSLDNSPLPPGPSALPPRSEPESPDPILEAREGLRLRARWVQELSARAVRELARRMLDDGRVAELSHVRWITWSQLEAAVRHGTPPRPTIPIEQASAPLPSLFRLSPSGSPIALQRRSTRNGARGAGGGRGAGTVIFRDTEPSPGDVLVVSTLDPDLAPLLPGLGGLVAETGSVLSHLAILAREMGVPTVVGVSGALDRFSEGETIVVDGTTGEVAPVEDALGVTA